MLIVQDVEILAFNVLEHEKHHLATALSLSYTLEPVIYTYICIYIVQKKKKKESSRPNGVSVTSGISFTVRCCTCVHVRTLIQNVALAIFPLIPIRNVRSSVIDRLAELHTPIISFCIADS